MNSRGVQIRFEGPHEKPWRIYWSNTQELVTPMRFATLEEAGPIARAFFEEWNADLNVERSE